MFLILRGTIIISAEMSVEIRRKEAGGKVGK